MPSSIIRARTIFTEPADRRHWHEIDDGAVLQRDGVIAEIGPAAELIARHPEIPVLGTGRQVLLPGFVNAHHHVGLTPVQLGSPDMPLELWFVTRLVARRVDLYLDTLYSAFEMIASGITTVQHLHGWLPGGLEAVDVVERRAAAPATGVFLLVGGFDEMHVHRRLVARRVIGEHFECRVGAPVEIGRRQLDLDPLLGVVLGAELLE